MHPSVVVASAARGRHNGCRLRGGNDARIPAPAVCDVTRFEDQLTASAELFVAQLLRMREGENLLIYAGERNDRRVAEAIRARGQKAEPLTLDVRDVETAKAAIAAQAPFDILVNNAGTNKPAPFIDVKVEDFDFVFSLNVRAAYFVAQAVARRLIEAKRPGSIINMSSQMGLVGGPTRTVYCATKHAMEGFTKAMAIDLAPHKIRVNTLAPTFIETPMTRPFFENKAFREDTLRRIKLGRLGQLEDLTGAIVFLASDAASFITGTTIAVDGGYLCSGVNS